MAVLSGPRRSGWLQSSIVLFAIVFFILAILQVPMMGQVRRGSLSGTVYDPTGAVIVDAQISLKDEATGVARQTVSNGSGFFHIEGVEPGTYTVLVTAKGFDGWEQRHIAFDQADNKTLEKVALKMSSGTEKIEIVANEEVVPTTTSESRTTLNNSMVTEMAIQGRDAAELIKIMPGMGMVNGLNNAQWNSQTTQINSGPVGQYSASGGQPYGGLSMTTDGAQIVDPGNQGTQISNVNQDMTQEVTVLNAAYGADAAKGPVTFQAIGKSGGKDFHGSAYLYTRNGNVNAEDAYLKSQGEPAPIDSYYYPGGQIGGPVLIPGTGFNKNRDKLFFFAAFEYMKQQPSGTLHQIFTPDSTIMGGNLSTSYLQSLGLGSNGGEGTAPCDPSTSGQWWYGNWCGKTDPATSQTYAQDLAGGQIPTSMMDPNSLALASLFPKPNHTSTASDPYNYQFLDNPPVNRWELRGRLDYNLSQSTRISGSYTRQDETDTNNFGVWWWPGDTTNYPTPMDAKQKSYTANVSATTVFSPTLTNDATFAYAYFINPVRPVNPGVVNPAKVGFTATGPFAPAVLPVVPDLISWSCNTGGSFGCFPGSYAPAFAGGFQSGAFGADKTVPSITDNVSKVWKTHTLKFGFYWDSSGNNQTEGYGDWGQGQYDFETYANFTTGNVLADFLLGHAAGYSQISKVPVDNMKYHQISFYGQDQWKAMRKLTLTYGLRMDHEGQWYVNNGQGLAVFNPATYNNDLSAPQFTGMEWHGKASSVPLSGWSSPTFYYAPRVGAAYDLFGNGRTVLRGGFGVYRWQVAYNDASAGVDIPLGAVSITCSGLTSLAQSGTSMCTPGGFSGGRGSNGSANALKLGDNLTPYTENWTVIVSQQVPWHSTLELQYQGNRTRDALLAGNGGNAPFYTNINKMPIGAIFGTDPVLGTNPWLISCASSSGCAAPASSAYNDYRPYANYSTALNVLTHGSYSNYNAMMVSWQKQRGPVTFMTNYTFSKTMGIRDGQTDNGNGDGAIVDAFTLRNNYGPLAYDHTSIFNAAYVIHLPSAAHGNAALEGLVNGWELSGITQVQSGAPIQPNTGGNLYAGFTTNGPNGGPSNVSILGTDSMVMLPVLICDPRTGLTKGQYYNPNCFAAPLPRQDKPTVGAFPGLNGQAIWPYIHGPAFVSNDLSLYKNFKLKESKTIQFRLNAFNFLNHPLKQFTLNPNGDVNLKFNGYNTTGGTYAAGGIPVLPTSCTMGAVGCNANTAANGIPAYEVGRRVMEFAVKFNF